MGDMGPTLGIEEEFVLLDPASLQTVDIAHGAVEELASTGGGIVAHEFFRSQVEFASPVCESASDAREAIHAFRDDLGEWARQAGAIAAGTGTPYRTRATSHVSDGDGTHGSPTTSPGSPRSTRSTDCTCTWGSTTARIGSDR